MIRASGYFCVCLFLTGCLGQPDSAPSVLNISLSQIRPYQVHGNDDRLDYPDDTTIDGDRSTFMTTPELSIGTVKIIAYKFSSSVNITEIVFEDNYTETYAMGDLTIQTSNNSSNGIDGDWTTIATLSGSSNDFVDGDGTVPVSATAIGWVRLRMEYTGTGAYGFSPSFYLSEVSFYGN